MTARKLDAATTAGVTAAYARAGYVQSDGKRDSTKLRARLLDCLAADPVASPKERPGKALTMGALVAQVFPALPGPDAWEDSDDPTLNEAVWERLCGIVRTETRTNAKAPLQRAVAAKMGNGYVLCHTKIPVSHTAVDAAYISDNSGCIQRDFVEPGNARVERVIKAELDNRVMLMQRQPEQAKHWAQGAQGYIKSQLTAASTQIQLALDAVSAPSKPDGDEADED